VGRSAVFIVGTRAQLIKIAPVAVACERKGIDCVLLMTGQHRETMQDLIAEFGIASPQVAAVEADEHSTVSSLLRWLPAAYRGVKARLALLASRGEGRIDVMVHGDTLSTLVGAFAAKRSGARVVHLESGLTSGRLLDPFPEEVCRRLVFRMTDVAMCPNAEAADYMRRAHRRAAVVDTGGNTILDAVALTGAVRATGAPGDYMVASLHRFQNIYDGARLRRLVDIVETASPSLVVHFVLHPATRKRLEAVGLLPRLQDNPRVRLLPRMGYRDFLTLAAGAACVLTDGGSNQEELAALGVPTIVMRAHTERPDGLGGNAVMEADVTGGVESFIASKGYEALRHPAMRIGDEGPSQRIVDALWQDS
jgi:UDP-N-acetylglucosamine 2-epimerase (non-hydrolysing)